MATTSGAVTPFELEQAYRAVFRRDLVDLSTSAPTPPSLAALGANPASLMQVDLGYGPGGGSLELRSAIAALYRDLGPENVVVTAGAIEAIRATGMALTHPGQRVLVQSPCYGAIAESILAAGARPVEWCTTEDFSLPCGDANLPELAFINSPHGPSGAIVRGLDAYPGRLVVDEVYRPLSLYKHVESALDVSEDAIVIGDLSKPLGLGGLRIGWIASRDLEALQQCADALDYLSGSVSVLSDHVACLAFRRFDALVEERLQIARDNLMELSRFVERNRSRVEWTPPQAGITACIRLRAGSPDETFFAGLRDRGVFMLPGRTMGVPDCLRIGLGLAPDRFRWALGVLDEALDELPATDAAPTSPDSDVILFTKLPFVGHGKSRLAAGVGQDAAFDFARAFLRDSLRMADAESRRLFISVDSEVGMPEIQSAYAGSTVIRQADAPFGRRLGDTFEQALRHGARRPLLIGSDSPTLPRHLIEAGQQALRYHDIVIGPTVDGGYYAIGMNQPHGDIFESIDYGSPEVFPQTLARIKAAGLSAFVLPTWYDIDTVEDLDRARPDIDPDSATANALHVMEDRR